MFDLTGKNALVTGATSGIGRAVVEALHSQGAVVAGTGRREANLNEIKGELGERFIPMPSDLSDVDALSALHERADEALGGVSILVNSAGLARDSLLLRMRDEAWDEVMAVNLKAAMILCRQFLRGMMKNRWGRIINVTSVVGSTGNAGQANYSASKAGLTGLTKSLAMEVANRNITVNAVSPGMISTAMTGTLSEKVRELMVNQIPVGRPGEVQEVAAAVVFLASQESSYITGTTLHVNGGMAMH